MQSKFFKRRPIKGMPVAAIEADGLAAMDHAWATLQGRGCKIDWANGTPTVVVSATGRMQHSFMPVPYVNTEEEENTLELKALGGFVFFGGTWYFIDEFFMGGSDAATHWWIEIDDDDPEDVQITVESGPEYPETEGLKFVRLFEFGEAGNLGTLIRRTTNDIIYGGDIPPGVEDGEMLYWKEGAWLRSDGPEEGNPSVLYWDATAKEWKPLQATHEAEGPSQYLAYDGTELSWEPVVGDFPDGDNTGDILYWDAAASEGAGAWMKLPIGTEDEVLTVGSDSKPAWDDAAADVDVKNSIEKDTEDDDKLQLVGDEDDPGNDHYYGTNSSGEKGYHELTNALPDPTTEYMALTVRNVAESEEPEELKWVEDWIRWVQPESE
jgi:hypothetical protein